MEYKCKSKIIAGQPCERNCVVNVDFEPRGCLYIAVAEEWEVLPQATVIKSVCDKCNGLRAVPSFGTFIPCDRCNK